jgi:hypothetical protein
MMNMGIKLYNKVREVEEMRHFKGELHNIIMADILLCRGIYVKLKTVCLLR